MTRTRRWTSSNRDNKEAAVPAPGGSRVVFLKFREKSWYMTIKKVVSIMLAMILLLSACSHATLDGAGTELEDAVANLSDAKNEYVQMVKGGYREDNPDLTYETAFSAFFGTPRWKYFTGDDVSASRRDAIIMWRAICSNCSFRMAVRSLPELETDRRPAFGKSKGRRSIRTSSLCRTQ